MCGIAGAVGVGASEDLVRGQLRLLEHRGPDASGVFSAGPASIGQTRLAVIDLVTGDPPMVSERGRQGAVLNGEIYNYLDLRNELRKDGHFLASQGDTEVLAHLAEYLPPVELAARLDGMFAFAIWDEARGRLILGRDRLGKKPLYYWTDGHSLIFASEIKALVAHPNVPRRLDGSALPDYLTFGYVPTPRTFFEEIQSLPPAHVLVLESDCGPKIEQYWDPAAYMVRDRAHTSLRNAATDVRESLSRAVERRLVADVPLGAFLSGGVDSSSVVALMAGHMGEHVATFTIGFKDSDGFDERPYARLVAERFSTDHTEFVVTADATNLVERLVWMYDQPFGDSSALPTYLLAELTRRHVTVALCGDGGDELFAGYDRFVAGLLLSQFKMLPVHVQTGVKRVLGGLPVGVAKRLHNLQRLLAPSDESLPDAFLYWVSCVPPNWRGALLGRNAGSVSDGYTKVWDDVDNAALLDKLLYLNLRTYLVDDLLVKVDRMTMAHGLEVRSPFLDTELVELAMGLPPSVKLRGTSSKRALKLAMADLLPPEILNRRKRGFGVPLERWFRTELRSYVEARLLSESARLRAHVAPKAVDRMVAEHLEGVANHSQAIWALITFEEFLRKESW